MTKADEQIKALNEQVVMLQDSIAASEEACAGYRIACEQAEHAERLVREELEDVQRENMRLKGRQDCAREILNGSRQST